MIDDFALPTFEIGACPAGACTAVHARTPGTFEHGFCTQHAQPLTYTLVSGVMGFDECGPACHESIGVSCSCSCGGSSHGGAWLTAVHPSAVTVWAQDQLIVELAADGITVVVTPVCGPLFLAAAEQVRNDRSKNALELWCQRSGCTDVYDWLLKRGGAGGEGFAPSVFEQGVRVGRLTENQVAAVRKILARDAAKAAAPPDPNVASVPFPTDGARHEVAGKVMTVKSKPGFQGQGVTFKMLVEVDWIDGKCEGGFKVFTSIPKGALAWCEDQGWTDIPSPDGTVALPPLRGHRIQFTALLEASKDDTQFGFGSRPTSPIVDPLPPPAPGDHSVSREPVPAGGGLVQPDLFDSSAA